MLPQAQGIVTTHRNQSRTPPEEVPDRNSETTSLLSKVDDQHTQQVLALAVCDRCAVCVTCAIART